MGYRVADAHPSDSKGYPSFEEQKWSLHSPFPRKRQLTGVIETLRVHSACRGLRRGFRRHLVSNLTDFAKGFSNLVRSDPKLIE
jgi:hypothetical protein